MTGKLYTALGSSVAVAVAFLLQGLTLAAANFSILRQVSSTNNNSSSVVIHIECSEITPTQSGFGILTVLMQVWFQTSMSSNLV